MSVKIDLKCASCGSNRFQLGDAPADDFIVECGECGHVIGTMGQLKDKLAEEVLRRTRQDSAPTSRRPEQMR